MPSRHRRDSCPSHNEVGGFFFDFEAIWIDGMRRGCGWRRGRAYSYCLDAIAAKCRWSRLLGALLIVREATDAIAATDCSVTVSIYTGTIVEVASPEEIGPAVLNVVKASNDVSKVYGFRKLTPTTLAHEYTLNRSDDREKNSLAVLNLLKMLELDALGSGQSELKHCVGLQVEPDIHVPGTVTHVAYLMKPQSTCDIKCFIESTEFQSPLFEQSAVFIARIKLHEDSEPYHPKKGPGSGNPYSITIEESGKADVVLRATSVPDGIRLLKEKGITTVSRSSIYERLSGKTRSNLVQGDKTFKFAHTKRAPLPKKEDLATDMYLVLPLNNEELLEALREGFGVSAAARAAFLDLKAFRADPLQYFKDQKGNILRDELKEIVARGFVTKEELQGAVWPYLTGYKIRMDAQRDRVLASTDFIKDHVASTQFDEDAATLKDRVDEELAWLYDAADAFDKAQDAAAAQRAAAKAAKALDKASPKKPSRKRKATVPKETFINSDDASGEEAAAGDEESAVGSEDCVSDDDMESHHGDSSGDSSSDDDDVMPVARPLPDNHGPQSFDPFDRVDAFYRPADKWYPATVRSQNENGTYNVEYDDGYFEDLPVNLLRVKRRKVAAPPAAGAYQIGDRVEARYMGGNWFPGKVKTCHKEGTYAIKFDDDDVDDLVLPCDIRRAP